VGKKALANTRSANMTEVLKKKEKNFAAANDKTKNVSAADLQKEETSITKPEEKKPGLLDSLGDMGGGLLKFIEVFIADSGFVKLLKLTPTVLLGTFLGAMGWREMQALMKTDFSKISSKFVEVLDKKGLWEAMKETLSSDQVKALETSLAKAVLAGFHDTFDPLMKGLAVAFPSIAKYLTAAPKAVDNAVANVGEALHRNLDSDAPKQLPVTPISGAELKKYEKPTSEFDKAWKAYDLKKESKKSFLDFFTTDGGEDETMDLVEAKRKEEGLLPLPDKVQVKTKPQSSGLVQNIAPVDKTMAQAERVVGQQNQATKTDVATTAAIQNGGMNTGGNGGGSMSSNTSNTSNNTTVINNYGKSLQNTYLDEKYNLQ
jgi:hypothetical protein